MSVEPNYFLFEITYKIPNEVEPFSEAFKDYTMEMAFEQCRKKYQFCFILKAEQI